MLHLQYWKGWVVCLKLSTCEFSEHRVIWYDSRTETGLTIFSNTHTCQLWPLQPTLSMARSWCLKYLTNWKKNYQKPSQIDDEPQVLGCSVRPVSSIWDLGSQWLAFAINPLRFGALHRSDVIGISMTFAIGTEHAPPSIREGMSTLSKVIYLWISEHGVIWYDSRTETGLPILSNTHTCQLWPLQPNLSITRSWCSKHHTNWISHIPASSTRVRASMQGNRANNLFQSLHKNVYVDLWSRGKIHIFGCRRWCHDTPNWRTTNPMIYQRSTLPSRNLIAVDFTSGIVREVKKKNVLFNTFQNAKNAVLSRSSISWLHCWKYA